MRAVQLSTHDGEGGAGRAALRLHRGLTAAGVDSRVVVQQVVGDDPRVGKPAKTPLSKLLLKLQPMIDPLPLQILYPGRESRPWNLGWFRHPIAEFINRERSDIAHCHWIGKGFVPVRELSRISCPVVWTLHDSGAFTGGCLLPGGCTRYEGSCGLCPQLRSTSPGDLSHLVWKAKMKHFRRCELTVVCPSLWMASRAKRSPLFEGKRVEVVPNGVDAALFKPLDKHFCRDLLGIPREKKVILFGADHATRDSNKGFPLLVEACRSLAGPAGSDGPLLAVFGASHLAGAPQPPLQTLFLGRLHDEWTVAAALSASDVVAVPSLQENLPYTAMEALSCGTPVVAFDVGGLSDLVEHGRNGYLAKPYEAEDLADGIRFVLQDPERWRALSARAREKVESQFDVARVARCHIDLYEDVLSPRRDGRHHP